MIFSRMEFLSRTQLDREILDICIAEDWLVPGGAGPETEFSEADIARAVLIHDLMQGMGVNAEGVGVILHLLDQMHGLRQAMAAVLQAKHRLLKPPDAE